MYLRLAFMTRKVDWFHKVNCKQWVKLEEDVIAMKLKSLPWVAVGSQPPGEGDAIFGFFGTETVGFIVVLLGLGL